MKPDQIFIGDIRKCIKYEENSIFSNSIYIGDQCLECNSFGHIAIKDELYKEKAILIKFKNGGYVDLERLNSILDYFKIYHDITKNGYILGGLMMSTFAYANGGLFVDEKSLKPYYADNKQASDISVRQLKKQIKSNSK